VAGKRPMIPNTAKLDDLSLSDYLSIAKYCILHYVHGPMKYKMVGDDDAVGGVATEIMLGIGKYNPERGMSLNTYANMRAKTAIYRWLNNYTRNSRVRTNCRLERRYEHTGLSAMLEIEQGRLLNEAVNDRLTEYQRLCLEMYYFKNMLLKDIADIYGVSKQAISQNIRRAEKKLGGAVTLKT